jgi:hypothetical protein
MKKYAFLFAMALVWGCQDKAVGPDEKGQIDAVQYGSSVLTLPGIPGLAKTAAGTAYKLQLVITGPGMDPMTFSFPLGGTDTAVVIDKIPAGTSRLFTGTLYSPQGPTHEGSAITEIIAGKTAFVKLFLRKTGSAQIDVIIEGINDSTAGGCYELDGKIDTLALTGATLEIIGNDGSQLWAYVYQAGGIVGKFWGTFDVNKNFTGEISMPGIASGIAMFKGAFSIDYSAFKGQVYSMNDTLNQIGLMYGFSIPCDTIVPPTPCQTDTMGGTSSCKDVATWVKYATEECSKSSLTLGSYSFMEPCASGTEKTFRYICYECCKAKGK